MKAPKANLFFHGVDTGIPQKGQPMDVLIITLIEQNGKNFYLNLIKNGMVFKPNLKTFLDKAYNI